MKCKLLLSTIGLFVAALFLWSCNESLPVYSDPQNVIAVRVGTVEQLNDRVAPPGAQVVHFVVEGENVYDEVFQDSVRIQGTMKVWWKRKPSRFRTLSLSEANMSDRSLISAGKMQLLPGQKFTLDVYWDLRSDAGFYLPLEMNFLWLTRRLCDYNVACADPEEFVIETSLIVYPRLGTLNAPVKEFSFIGRTCVTPGFLPCSTTGGGGG